MADREALIARYRELTGETPRWFDVLTNDGIEWWIERTLRQQADSAAPVDAEAPDGEI